MDSLGILPPVDEIRLEAGSVTELRLGVPSMATVLDRHCDGSVARGQRVLVGVVRDRFAVLIPNAAVQAEWQVIPVLNEDQVVVRGDRRSTRTDEHGRFALCNLPEGPLITLRGLAERADATLDGMVELRFEQGRDEVVVLRPDQSADRFYAPNTIWKADLSLFPTNQSSR